MGEPVVVPFGAGARTSLTDDEALGARPFVPGIDRVERVRRRTVLLVLIVAAVAFGGLTVRSMVPVSTKAGVDEASPGLGAPILSARRAPELLAATASDAGVRRQIDQLFSDPRIAAANKGICVVARRDGRLVANRLPGTALIPASTLKMLTATAALDRLGGSGRFTTSVVAADGTDKGTVDGPLYLVGGGDPLLFTNDFYGSLPTSKKLARTSLEDLADRIVASGVRTITGGVVGDDTMFDAQRAIPTWEPSYVPSGEVGAVGALLVNQGRTADGRGVVADPAAQAAQALSQLLGARGVDVRGDARSGAAPAKAEAVASVQSPPLVDVVKEMLTVSDNTTAEMLLKATAATISKVAVQDVGGQKDDKKGSVPTFGGERITTAQGAQAARAVLQRKGLPLTGFAQADGSGLDRGNRTTCVDLEEALRQDGVAGTIATSLPRAGESGTLADRMNGTVAVGRVRAKTGSLNNVSALSGWAAPQSGGSVSFAVISNGVDTPTGRQLEDRIAVILAGSSAPAPAAAYAPGSG